MESSVAVGSNGFENGNPSSSAVGNEFVQVSNEQVETKNQESECQTKPISLEIVTNNQEKVEVSDVAGNDSAINSFPTKDTNEEKPENSEKAAVEDTPKKSEVATVKEEVGKNEVVSPVLKKEETSTAENVAEKNEAPTVKDVVEENEASTIGVLVEGNEAPTVGVEENEAPNVGDVPSTNEPAIVEDISGKEEVATTEDVLGKDEAEGGGSPCSQEDMFASEPPSPGIIPCSIGNTVATEHTEECARDDKMEADNTAELAGEGRASKRQHVEIEEDCTEMKKSLDVEGNLPKRARHSVEIVFECPKSQEANDVPVTSSINKSEEFLDLTGGTEESVHLHYSPSPEYDIPETQFEPDLEPRAPSLATVVIGSDDEDAETTDKTVATEPVTQCATSCLAVNTRNEDTEDISVHKSQGADAKLKSVTATCTIVDSKTSSEIEAPVPRCPSPPEEDTSVTKDDGSTSLPQRNTSPSQQKSTQSIRPPAQGISSARVPVTSSPYADNIPVPQYESLCSSVEHQTPSPASCRQHNTSSSKCPTSKAENTDRVLEMTKDVPINVQVVLHYRETSKEVIFYEITQCDFIEGMSHSTTAETSSGTPMIDSKNTSPGSVTSVGPFPLPMAMRVSAVSSSSSSSLTSAAHLALSNASKRLRTGVEVLNLDLVASTLRKVGPESLPVPSAVFAGNRLQQPTTSDKTTDTADDFNKENTDTKETVGTDHTVTTPVTSEKNQRSTTRKRGRARGGSSRGRSSARGQSRTQPSPLPSEPLTWGTEDASRFKGMLHPGASAFARWTDKRYYSAKLTEKQRDGRWLVAFDDGSVKTVKEEFVIPVETLTKGTLVYATLPDGSCADGIVSALFVQDNEEQYGVELDDREVIVPRREIFLTEDQARLLLEGATVTLPAPSTPGRLADVDLNNVVAGKRLRTPTHATSGPATPRTPGPSGNACPNKISRSSSPSDRGSVTGATTDDAVSVVGVEPESEGCKVVPVSTGSSRGKGKVSAKGKGKALFATTNILKESAELDETLGPIPPKDSKIFEGMIFLLTSVDFEPNKSDEKVHEICSDSEGEREFSSYRFVKDRLRMQLEAGGGMVLESLDDVPEDRLRDTILIANRPCLTAKYISCLAKAVKIINHDFVIQRAKGDTCTPNAFGLPLGWSLLDERYVGNGVDLGAIQRTRKGGSRQLLARKKLVLVHETPQFLAFWQKVLNDLGAKTTTFSPNDATKADAELKSADAIISDASCPPQIQERAREWHKPLISTTWITQCLINREFLAFDALPNFRYDFSD